MGTTCPTSKPGASRIGPNEPDLSPASMENRSLILALQGERLEHAATQRYRWEKVRRLSEFHEKEPRFHAEDDRVFEHTLSDGPNQIAIRQPRECPDHLFAATRAVTNDPAVAKGQNILVGMQKQLVGWDISGRFTPHAEERDRVP